MRPSRLAFVASLVAGWASMTPAIATPVVITTQGQGYLYNVDYVTAINGLMVGGKEYNVSFMQYATDQTFWNNPVGVKAAADAIDAALNASLANALYLANVPVQTGPNKFVVASAPNWGMLTTGYSAHDWEEGWYGSSNNTAVFSLVSADPSRTAVPEPASIALIGTALVGLGCVRFRRAKGLADQTARSLDI